LDAAIRGVTGNTGPTVTIGLTILIVARG
jgi:hypothetical protein